jgi:effector-binding domain-containing protein
VISVKSPVSGSDRIQVYELPGIETAACTIHHGSYKTLNLAYNAILEWIDANGYQIVGPNREFYIQGGPKQDNQSYVTELQFSVISRH